MGHNQMILPPLPQSSAPIVVLVAVVFGAAVINGTVGIGFAQLSAAALTLVTDPHTSIVLLSVMVPPLAALQAHHTQGDAPGLRPLLPLIVAALIGVPVGVFLLGVLPTSVLAGALGCLTLLYVISSWQRTRWALDPGIARSVAPGVGLLAGVSNGMLGVSGPVLGPFLLSIGISTSAFAFTISVIYLSMSSFRLADLLITQRAPLALLLVGAVLLVPTLAGQRVGFIVQRRVDAEALRRLILVLLGLAALGLIGTGLRAFGL